MKIIVFFLMCFFILNLSKLEIRVLKPEEVYNIQVYIRIFKLLKIKVYTKSIKQKLKVEELIAKIDFKKSKDLKVYKDFVKKVNFNIKKLRLKIEVGSNSMLKTVFLNTILASNIAILLGLVQDKIKDKNLHYDVVPKFNKQKVTLKLDCIIQTNIVHISYIIYLLKKERRKQNELTSNRKYNVVCND